ncbi:GlcG/HbpS family heme-binding protein [Bordetella genomosp. 11]|nr:heme-binding protein [Bordetella genomosp. 11]
MKPVLTLDAAKRVAQHALDTARQYALKVAVAIVDDGGRLLYFERMDEVPWGSGEVALAKAASAAAYRRDTAVFDDRLANGRLAVLGQPEAFPIQGGVALRIGGLCVGAIGASGALASEDTMLCQAGAAALASVENDLG